jgi:hypothetical protein
MWKGSRINLVKENLILSILVFVCSFISDFQIREKARLTESLLDK